MPDLNAPVLHPIGTINMWHGKIANIDSGWFLCDGNNGTPDMTSRFIRGAGSGQDAGSTGGSDTHTLTEAEMAQHNHGINDPTHTHSVGANAGGSFTPGVDTGDFITGSVNPHGNSSGISLGNTGSGNSHENRPEYYELAFIQRKF